MDDAFGVGFIHTRCKLTEDLDGFFNGHHLGFDALGEGTAIHVTHHEIRLASIFTDIVHRHNGGVFERGDDLGFTLKPQFELRV